MGKTSLSFQGLTLPEVARHHEVLMTATYDFFATSNRHSLLQHPSLAGYAGRSIEDVRADVLTELDHTSALSVLSCVEAAVRTDYLTRVYGRSRGNMSRALRAVYDDSDEKARLVEDLLACWRAHSNVPKLLIAELIAALKFRHWLAHGRYWTPKFGRRYDYQSMYGIAYSFLSAMASNN